MSETRVSQVIVYPIKSTAGIHLSHAFMEARGLSFDRRFVVTKPDGEFITARTHTKLLQVHSLLSSDGLHVRGPSMPSLEIRYRDFPQDYKALNIWGMDMQGQHCSTHADQWFSDLLGEPVQLLFCGTETERPIINAESYQQGQTIVMGEKLSFADAYPLLLISEASLQDLNSRLVTPVNMSRFRPNIVVKGCQAFAEDSWHKIRIGEVVFEASHTCSRCIMTTVEPTTGEPDPNKEPLTTLSQYRQSEDGKVHFGHNLIALNSGKISLFDTVEILEIKEPASFADNAPLQPQAEHSGEHWQAGSLATLECVGLRSESNNPSEDVKTFTFKHQDGLPASYLAGQFLSLELEIDGVPTYRNYTVSSSPSRPERVAITVKRVKQGLVSNWLHDNIKIGDYLRARAPSGKFHCFAAPQDKILLLSAGSGITPMLSILRWMSDMQIANDMVFFHSAQTEDDIIARQEIELLAKLHGRCQVIYTLTREENSKLKCFHGRLDQNMLKTITDLNQRQVFVCGPNPFMSSAKLLLQELGLPQEQYFEESFGAHSDENLIENKPVKILFDSWDTMVDGNTSSVILEQAEKAGVAIPFSCRGGFCGTCKVKLESGEIEQLEDVGLTSEEKSKGYILSCSCLAKSDLVISQV